MAYLISVGRPSPTDGPQWADSNCLESSQDCLVAIAYAQINRIETRFTIQPSTIRRGIDIGNAVAIVRLDGIFNRFDNLKGVRAFTGLVPKLDQSGNEDRNKGITKSGDPGLRQVLYLAADQARKIDPTLAAHYHRLFVNGKHHTSAVCTIATVLITRIAACWRAGKHYELRDIDDRIITAATVIALRKYCHRLMLLY